MKALLDRLHAKLGDLWWYSLMIFIACRSGDVIQAFIGLWLVPKYVGPDELGAVLPLQQLSNLFAVPLAVLATVFAKYVNTYATRGEYGKVKSFIHDVLWTACGVFLICIAVAYLVIPHFYVRLNVASGMLTILILVAGFASNIANLFTAALQGLKKFKTMTIQNLISAPIRLATLLVAMPIRALSGYILGQATPPATCSLLAAYSLHTDLKNIPADTSWRKDLPEIWRYLWPVGLYMTLSALCASVTTTVYRQRLPEIESAAYYLLSRFAEIASYVGTSMAVILFPLASEAHERRHERIKILHNTIAATLVISFSMTVAFVFLAPSLLSIDTSWAAYKNYAGILPILTLIAGLGTIISAMTSYEMACQRFSVAISASIFNLTWTTVLVCLTGYAFFEGILPSLFFSILKSIRLENLATLSYVTLGVYACQTIILYIVVFHNHKRDAINHD